MPCLFWLSCANTWQIFTKHSRLVIRLNLVIDRFTFHDVCFVIMIYFNLCYFRVLAYTALDKL